MEFLSIFLIGFGASFFGSLVSGGLAMFSLTGLMFLGLSPLVAMGTFRLGLVTHSLGGLSKFVQTKKIVWHLVPFMTVFGLLGTIIGASLIINTDEAMLEKIIGFVILLFIPISIFKPKLGVVERVVTLRSRWLGHASYFITSIWGGSVSVGTGLMSVYPMMHFYGLTLLQVKGTNRLPSLVKAIAVLAIFDHFNLVDWHIGLYFALGMLLGSYFGAHYAIKIGDQRLRYVLLAFVSLFSLKLILGL